MSVSVLLFMLACTEVGIGKSNPGLGPDIEKVTISPEHPKVDERVRCKAKTNAEQVNFKWMNDSRGTEIGTGEQIRLSPEKILPGEKLVCEVTASSSVGFKSKAKAIAKPGCGFSEDNNLSNVDVSFYIFFSPTITDDVEPGYGGKPWDWDGSIPAWISTLMDQLQMILGTVSAIYPDPDLLAAESAVDQLDQILELIDQYGPELMGPFVPPDPNIYPYLLSNKDELLALNGVGDGLSWDDSYEVSFTLKNLNFQQISAIFVDMEDLDLSFNDNMGDYLDQGDTPLALTTEILSRNAHCVSTYYNPSGEPQSSQLAYIPGSILWMAIEVH